MRLDPRSDGLTMHAATALNVPVARTYLGGFVVELIAAREAGWSGG